MADEFFFESTTEAAAAFAERGWEFDGDYDEESLGPEGQTPPIDQFPGLVGIVMSWAIRNVGEKRGSRGFPLKQTFGQKIGDDFFVRQVRNRDDLPDDFEKKEHFDDYYSAMDAADRWRDEYAAWSATDKAAGRPRPTAAG